MYSAWTSSSSTCHSRRPNVTVCQAGSRKRDESRPGALSVAMRKISRATDAIVNQRSLGEPRAYDSDHRRATRPRSPDTWNALIHASDSYSTWFSAARLVGFISVKMANRRRISSIMRGVLAIHCWTPGAASSSLRCENSGEAFFILNASESGSTRRMWADGGSRIRLCVYWLV